MLVGEGLMTLYSVWLSSARVQRVVLMQRGRQWACGLRPTAAVLGVEDFECGASSPFHQRLLALVIINHSALDDVDYIIT